MLAERYHALPPAIEDADARLLRHVSILSAASSIRAALESGELEADEVN